jgi:osmotically-inducible protein OsmY
MIKSARIAFAAAIVAVGASSAAFAQSPTEEQTSQTVLSLFDHNATLSGDTLHVETVGNTVYIRGQVDSSLESATAVELARHVANVGNVVDMTSSASAN